MPSEAIATAQGLIGSALLHSVWLGLAAASVAALLSTRLESHRARRACFLAALGVAAIGPPAAAILQAMVGYRYEGPGIPDVPVRLEFDRADEPLAVPSASDGIGPTRAEATASWPAPLRAALDRATVAIRTAWPYAAACWGSGVLAAGTVLAIGAARLRRLRREARPDADLDARTRVLARRLRLRRVPTARVHAHLPEPCLAGVLRPTILLPEPWMASATNSEVDAVLAHELAHARRLDHVTNLMQRTVEACFFFHPCIHWLSRAARRESEPCADALAARITGDPLALAKALESVALLRPTRSRQPRLGLHLPIGGDRSSLLPRIQELLGMKPNRPRTSIWPFVGLPATFVVAMLSASVSPAQEAPQASGPDLPAMVDEGTLPFEADPRIVSAPVPAEVTGSAPWGTPEPEGFPLTPDERRLIGAAPATLSDEELVRLVHFLKPGQIDPSGLPRERLLELAVVDQISFEVRFLEVADDDWTRLSRDRLKPVKAAREGTAWLVEPPEMAGLLRETLRDSECRLLQAPKVTTFEEARVVIATCPGGGGAPPDQVIRRLMHPRNAAKITDRFAQTVEGLSVPRAPHSVLLNVLKGGMLLQATGRRMPKSHWITVKSAAFLPSALAEKGAAGPAAAVQRVTTEVPDDSTLVIDTGLDIALDVGTGSPPRRLRNFVLVTPRHIPWERPEDVPLVAPMPTVPVAK